MYAARQAYITMEPRTVGLYDHLDIKANGWIYLDGLQSSTQPRRELRRNVLATDLNEVWVDGFHRAISLAGYSPHRVDSDEHVDRIDDRIIADIRKSRFVVADFTQHKAGVYFEAGFAMGLGLPVIWTCRKEDMAELHFDIRQYNCIDWNSVADLETDSETESRECWEQDRCHLDSDRGLSK